MFFNSLFGDFNILNSYIVKSRFKKCLKKLRIIISKVHFDKSIKMTYHSNQATFNILASLMEIDTSLFLSHFLFQNP